MNAGHHHGHAHHHTANRTRLALALALTATVLAIEVVMALITGSLALLVDAAHMLTDTAGLVIALVAATLIARPPTAQRTWGFARVEVLAAGAQATILLAVGTYAFVEGVRRLINPPAVEAPGMLIMGIVGLLANLLALGILSGGRQDNLNMRAAFLEVVNDALGSVAVIIAATVVLLTGWTSADAIAGMVIALMIAPRAVSILREAFSVLMEAAPAGLDVALIRHHLEGLPHVQGVHDLHVSRISTGVPVLSAHVVLEQSCFHDGHATEILLTLQACVAEHFAIAIEHSTFQLEPPDHADGEVGSRHCR